MLHKGRNTHYVRVSFYYSYNIRRHEVPPHVVAPLSLKLKKGQQRSYNSLTLSRKTNLLGLVSLLSVAGDPKIATFTPLRTQGNHRFTGKSKDRVNQTLTPVTLELTAGSSISRTPCVNRERLYRKVKSHTRTTLTSLGFSTLTPRTELPRLLLPNDDLNFSPLRLNERILYLSCVKLCFLFTIEE